MNWNTDPAVEPYIGKHRAPPANTHTHKIILTTLLFVAACVGYLAHPLSAHASACVVTDQHSSGSVIVCPSQSPSLSLTNSPSITPTSPTAISTTPIEPSQSVTVSPSQSGPSVSVSVTATETFHVLPPSSAVYPPVLPSAQPVQPQSIPITNTATIAAHNSPLANTGFNPWRWLLGAALLISGGTALLIFLRTDNVDGDHE